MKKSYESLLVNWDIAEEDRRVKFLDLLYDFYGVTNGCYTGLWDRFKDDIASFSRLQVTEDLCHIEELFSANTLPLLD